MRILAFTTSTPRFEAALIADGEVLASSAYVDEKGHAEKSIATIDAMFRDAALAPSDFDAIACDVGPGSFTGVRIGVAGAKGIALARGIPLVGVTSLEALAFGRPGRVEVRLDARRGEVFSAVYEAGECLVAPHIVKQSDATEIFASPRAVDIAAIALRRLDGEIPAADDVEPVYARDPDAKKPTAPPKLSRA